MSFIAIKHRRDTAANWTANNPVLLEGQLGFELDSFTLSGGKRIYKAKFGDGSTAWNSLPYFALSAGGGGGATAFIDLTDVPSSYTGQGGKYLKVIETADGVEFEAIEAADLPTGIDAAKIGDGSVSNTEFQYLGNVTSDIQTQLNSKQGTGNYFNKTTDDTDDIIEGTNKFATAAEKAKLANITITQAVDLDAIETRVNELDAAVILKGTWAANSGTFPGGGLAQAGWSYIVSIAGTVDGVSFNVNDRIIAILDNASTSTFASNWFKADYTDQFLSLDGNTGAATLGSVIANLTEKTTPVDADKFAISDSAASNASKFLSWSNLKATIKGYYDSVVATLTNKTIDLTNNTLSTTVAQLNASISDGNIIPEAGGTFTGDIQVPADPYDATNWNGNNEVPTKNDIRDKIESMGGGGLTNWTESYSNASPNNTVTVVSFVPNTADTHTDGVYGQKGNGAWQVQIADSSTTGGNKRGTKAFDGSMVRAAADRVASGAYSLNFQYNNKASGDYSVCLVASSQATSTNSVAIASEGVSSGASAYCFTDNGVASGSYSGTFAGYGSQSTNSFAVTLGGRAGKSYLRGGRARGLPIFTGALGEAQTMDYIQGVEITGTSAGTLTMDSSVLAVIDGTNAIWNCIVQIEAYTKTVGSGSGTAGHGYVALYSVGVKLIGGTTSLIGSAQALMTAQADASMSTASVSITADDTNDCLKIQFTPPSSAASDTVTRVVATVYVTQGKY